MNKEQIKTELDIISGLVDAARNNNEIEDIKQLFIMLNIIQAATKGLQDKISPMVRKSF